MKNRWSILAVLFLVRTSFAIQFQAVAALSPVMMNEFGIGLAEIGVLIGLYLAPGIVVAYPGGSIGRRYGDTRAVAGGLVLMIGGGTLMALGDSWEAQVAGRLVAGTGGVVLNVLMSKMVQDWFAGREIATAMGIFVNSWPIGIAAALVILPGSPRRADTRSPAFSSPAWSSPGWCCCCSPIALPPRRRHMARRGSRSLARLSAAS